MLTRSGSLRLSRLLAAAPVGLVRAEQVVQELLVRGAVDELELDVDLVLAFEVAEPLFGNLFRGRRAPEAGLVQQLPGLLELRLGVEHSPQQGRSLKHNQPLLQGDLHVCSFQCFLLGLVLFSEYVDELLLCLLHHVCKLS